MQNLVQICCSIRSVIVNVTATQYTCSLNGVPPPPLTSTVKSSLFTHAHSSPLSLAARLHQCHLNCSRYINNGWTFSGQTSSYIIEVGNTTLRSGFKCQHCPLLVMCLWARHSISLCLSFLFSKMGAVIVEKT